MQDIACSLVTCSKTYRLFWFSHHIHIHMHMYVHRDVGQIKGLYPIETSEQLRVGPDILTYISSFVLLVGKCRER